MASLRRVLGFVGGVALSSSITPVARAAPPAATATAKDASDPSDQARRQYQEGERAFNQGDYRRAGTLFESAYRARPHHAALWSAARAWIHGSDEVRAANLLERYLREAPPSSPDRDRATETTRQLEKKLARVDIVMGSASSAMIDGTPVALERVWVLPGEHLVTATTKASPVRKTIRVAAGERISVSLEPDTGTRSSHKPLPPWVAYVGAGVTVLGGGAIVVSGLDASSKGDVYASAFARRAPVEEVRGAYTDAQDAQTRTNVVIGATVGVAVLTGIAALFLIDWDSSSDKGDRTP